jgi:hypothetical protein
VVFFTGHYAFILWVGLIRSGISAMERNFTVESKFFSLSVLEGASMVRVEEKRKSFFVVIVLSTRCSDWLASMLETLLGFSGDHDFVKSFREGSKLLIACRGENKAGRFLEAAAYGLGGRRGLILIPEGRGGWGWRKFSGELRTVSVSLSVGCGLGLSASDKKDEKVEGTKLSTGLDSLGATEGSPLSGGSPMGVKLGKGTGPPSFAEVVRSGATDSVLGCRSPGHKSGSGDAAKVVDVSLVAEWCDLKKQPPVDCSALEKQAPDSLGKDLRVDECLSSRVCVSCSACVFGVAVVEGDTSLQKESVSGVFGQILEIFGRLSSALIWACGASKRMGFESSVGLKHRLGFVAGRMLKRCKAAIKGSRFRDRAKVLKPIAKRATESAPESVSGRVSAPDLGCPTPEVVGVLTPTFSAFVEHSSSIPSVVPASEFVLKKSSFSSEDPMTLGSTSSGSTSPVARFSFPPVASSRLEGISPVVLGFSSAPLVAPTRSGGTSPVPSLLRAAELGKRLRLSSPVLSNSKPFRKCFRKAREARKMHLDGISFADALEALRPGAIVPGSISWVPHTRELVALTLPVQDSVVLAVSVKDKGSSPALMRGFLRRGFLNPSPGSVKEGAAASSSSIAIKGEVSLTQSQKWPVGIGPSKVVVREQGDELWDGEDGDFPLPLGVFPPDWALDWELESDEGLDPSLAILDAIEENFHRGVKAARPKSKGRREVLNLASSINYGDSCASSRRKKGKVHMV